MSAAFLNNNRQLYAVPYVLARQPVAQMDAAACLRAYLKPAHVAGKVAWLGMTTAADISIAVMGGIKFSIKKS